MSLSVGRERVVSLSVGRERVVSLSVGHCYLPGSRLNRNWRPDCDARWSCVCWWS